MEQFIRQTTTPFELSTEPQVPGCGPAGKVAVAFLGEAPGAEEAKEGRPFVGPAGTFLSKNLCYSASIWWDGVWRTNVIDRQPPTWNGKTNAINSPSAIEAIEAQTPELWRELTWLVRSKHVRVIVATGGTATLALGISAPITSVRGSVYELSLDLRRVLTQEELQDGVHADCLVVPILHPSGLRRNGWWKRASGSMGDTLATIDDLKKVRSILDKGYERPIERFKLYPNVDEIVSFIHDVVARRVLVAVDTESRGDIDLEPSKRTLTIIGLASSAHDAICIAFEREDRMLEWTNGSLDRINEVLNLLFTKGRLMFQNALHDVPLLQASSFTVDNCCVVDDTLLLHHAVNPEDKHNLGYIVSRFGTTTFWKDVADKSYNRLYNARDCVVLHQVRPALVEAMHKVDPTDRLYNEVYVGETMALLPSIIRMHTTGIKIDQRRLRMWQQFAGRKLEAATNALNTAANVPATFNWASEHDTQALFFGVYPEEKLRQDRIILSRSEADIRAEGDAKRAEVEAEIAKCEAAGRVATKKYAALLDRREKLLTFDAPKYWYESKERLEKFNNLRQIWPGIAKWNGRKTDKKQRVSLSKKTYPEMLNFAFRRQEELNALVRPTEAHQLEKAQLARFVSITTSYGTYSRVSHVCSTYTNFDTWSDGRVHGRLIQSGTATGRLAMREPNLQNIPKRERWAEQVRRVFVPDDGCVFLLFDYSNIEFVMLAYTTGEPGFVKIVEDDLNVHDLNTPILFAEQGINGPEHPQWKAGRRAAKVFQFGGVQYGGGDMEVHRNIVADAPELGLTMAQYKAAKARYLNTYKTLDAWQKYVKTRGVEKRRTETPFGRVRLLNGNDRDIEKESLNTPIQGAAAHVINRAQIRVEKALTDRGLMKAFDDFSDAKLCRTVLQIHDQLIFECPISLVGKVVPMILVAMEAPIELTDWKGNPHTVYPKVDPEFGLDMFETESIPLKGIVVQADEFECKLAELTSRKVTFTDEGIDDVDTDTFEEEIDDAE